MNYWFEEELAIKPEEFVKISPTKYIQRRNIREYNDGYICEARFISIDEYELIIERRNEIKQVVAETNNTQEYLEGYKAAMILLGGEDNV